MDRQQDRRIIVDAIACPQCSGPLEPGRDRCPWCGRAVVLDSRAAPLDMEAIRREYAHLGLEELRARANRRPIEPAARYALGMAYADLGLLDEAAEALRSAADRMPEHAPFQAALARVYHRQDLAGVARRGGMAEDRIERALARDPGNLDALLLASERAARAGDVSSSFVLLRRAAEIDPEAARPLAQGFIDGNRQKIRDSWAYAPHRLGATMDGKTNGGAAFGAGCMIAAMAGGLVALFWAMTVGNRSGSPVSAGWWWAVAAVGVAVWVANWVKGSRARKRSARLMRELLPDEQAIVDGTATTMEMVDALDRWAAVELDNLRRASEAAARKQANERTLVASAAALDGIAKGMNALGKPTRSRRRKSGPW